MERSWQKAQNELSLAIWTIKYASDVPAGLLKNENVNTPQRLFNNRDQKQIDETKSEFEQINIPHDRDERVSTLGSYWEKYATLKSWLEQFTKAKNELADDIEVEREFYSYLYRLRVKFPIQDAFMLPEFKKKRNLVHKTNQKTLYCHVISKPELYIPKNKSNYLNKVLLIK